MTISDFQRRIEGIYYERDKRRGMGGTFMWFVEEVGELATALRNGDEEAMREEFGDVLAWLCILASLAGIEMTDAAAKYAAGCPSCRETPCTCSEKV